MIPLVFLLSTAGACAKPPAVTHDPLAVEVVRLRSGDASSELRTTGEVRAKVESGLSFRIAGKVIERKVDVGDHVAAGALLARLDASQQAADVAVAQASVRSAEASVERTKIELGREQTLFDRHVTPKATLDNAQQMYAAALSELAGANANLDLSRQQLSYTELRATRAGVITARSVELGQVVQPGAIVFSFADDGTRDAVFNVDERVASRLAAGTPVALALVDAPETHAHGTVREIAPSVDDATASVRVKVTIDDAPTGLALGAPIVGRLAFTAPKTFTLPTAAVTADDAATPAVWVVDPSTKAVALRKVDVASYDSGAVVVRAGLNDGELVVARGASRLRPAQVVSFDETSKS